MDPLGTIGIFTPGASAGSLFTHIKRTNHFHALDRTENLPVVPSERFRITLKTRALVPSSDAGTIAMLKQLFRELRMDMLKCHQQCEATEQLASARFNVVVLDFDDLPGCSGILTTLREVQPNHETMVLALASDEAAETAVGLGTTFVARRPLLPRHIRNLLKTAHGRILRKAQTHFRSNINTSVWAKRADGSFLSRAVLLMALSSLRRAERLELCFVVPDTDIVINGAGKVIWDADPSDNRPARNSLPISLRSMFQ